MNLLYTDLSLLEVFYRPPATVTIRTEKCRLAVKEVVGKVKVVSQRFLPGIEHVRCIGDSSRGVGM